MARQSKKTHAVRLPPFVAMSWAILNSQAHKELPPSGAKALPYFLGRPHLPFTDPNYTKCDFCFSYAEGERLGFSPATWFKVLSDLVRFGFIDPVGKGGLRGHGKTMSRYRLSKRWEKFGKPDFETIDLKSWGT